MPPYQVPEVMRVPLEELVLQIHLLGLAPAAPFLAAMLQPPSDKAVAAAVRSLQVREREGARRVSCDGVGAQYFAQSPRCFPPTVQTNCSSPRSLNPLIHP